MATINPVDASVLAVTGASLGTGFPGSTIKPVDVLYAACTDGGDPKLEDSSAESSPAGAAVAGHTLPFPSA